MFTLRECFQFSETITNSNPHNSIWDKCYQPIFRDEESDRLAQDHGWLQCWNQNWKAKLLSSLAVAQITPL